MARRSWIWLQLIVGWLPMGALFAVLIVTVHRDVQWPAALPIALRSMVAAALLGIPVRTFTRRVPWPRALTARFMSANLAAAVVYAFAWVVLNSLFESVVHRQVILTVGPGLSPSLVVGIWLYVMVAGVLYAVQTAERAASAEAAAVSSTLAALRAQLHPHFLFNALHTVIHLIPAQPRRAADAAEQIAGLLRQVLEHDRDLVPLSEELAFVERYLTVERLRFADRLRTTVSVDTEARDALIPSFALLTLVENAVRHGAEPNMNPTDVSISASVAGGVLTLVVRDTGVGAPQARLDTSNGTGLNRLRGRLNALYAGAATLEVAGAPAGGVTASLRVPVRAPE
jgi:signal transduction histidine kinase